VIGSPGNEQDLEGFEEEKKPAVDPQNEKEPEKPRAKDGPQLIKPTIGKPKLEPGTKLAPKPYAKPALEHNRYFENTKKVT